MTDYIELKNISKTYYTGKHQNSVLNNINLKLSAGQTASIIGPSGAGKSTLLNIIGLVLPPSGGELIINQKTTHMMNGKALAKLRNAFFGYVTQDFALIENDSVFENTVIPLLYSKKISHRKKDRLQRVHSVLEQVGLSKKIYEKAKTLSGGQRQRIAIARALINDPLFLLCDEPTGSLDKETGTEIINLLINIVKTQNKGLLMVTHNLSLASACELQLEMNNCTLSRKQNSLSPTHISF